MLWKGFLLSRLSLDCTDVFLLSVYQECLFQNGHANSTRPTTIGDLKSSSRRKRRITFADVEGLPLESVFQLSATDVAYTPGKIVPRLENTLKSPTKARPIPNRSFTRQCHFTQPGTMPDFYERIQRQKVMLEAVTPRQKLTHGTVRVVNMAYDKEVVVRWTRNKWRSFRETRCSYCHGQGCADGSTDRFCFTLPITEDDCDIEFVIRYKIEGGEFWDNHNQQNYNITIDR